MQHRLRIALLGLAVAFLPSITGCGSAETETPTTSAVDTVSDPAADAASDAAAKAEQKAR